MIFWQWVHSLCHMSVFFLYWQHPPPSSTPCPRASHDSSDCLSQLRETGNRGTQRDTRASVLCARKCHETLRMPKVFKSSFKQYCVGIGWLKSLEKDWKNQFLHLSHSSFCGRLRADVGPSPIATGKVCLGACAESDQPRPCPLTGIFSTSAASENH